MTINLLDQLKLFRSGKLSEIDDSVMYPLLRWISGDKRELEWCSRVNEHFFFIPHDMKKTLLYIGVENKNKFIKYPKGTKAPKSAKTDLKKKLIKEYYRWSEQEFNRNCDVIDNEDWKTVLETLGCEPSEYKVLGIKDDTVEKKKNKGQDKKVMTLSDF